MYSVPVTGGTPLKLNPPVNSQHGNRNWFRVSPDSRTVVFHDAHANKLYSIPASGGAPIHLVDSDIRQFEISPDSSMVVYAEGRALYSVPIAGGDPAQLGTGFGLSIHWFRFSPDSQTVVYQAEQDTPEIDELYSVPITGGTPIKLNRELFYDGDLAGNASEEVGNYFQFSPDSSTVVYEISRPEFYRGVTREIYSVPISGGTSTRLSHELDPFRDLRVFYITPDGSTVVYLAEQASGSADIYSVPIEGGVPTKLSDDSDDGGAFDIRLSRDGESVFYLGEIALRKVPVGGGTPIKLS